MLNLILVLLSLEEDPIFQEQACKKYALMAFCPYYFKMVFTLLTEVVSFYV